MAVTNANYIMPLKEVMLDVNKEGSCCGRRHGGYDRRVQLANQNFEVFLIEKRRILGWKPEAYLSHY